MRSYPQEKIVVDIKNVVEEVIDKSFSWGYFDGSAAGEPKVCGAGGKLV